MRALRTVIAGLGILGACAGAALAQEAQKPGRKLRWKDIDMPALRQFSPPKPERHVLPNGLVLFLIEDHELPTIDMAVMMRAGSVYEPREKAGMAAICGEVMRTGGSVSRSGDQIDEQLESIAASVEVGVSLWEAQAGLGCIKENFDETLAVLMDILEHPAFPQEKIDLAKKQAKSAIARRNDDPSGIARREYGRALYGDASPYGWTSEVATIDSIAQADLVGYHKRFFGKSDRTIVGVVGDFDAKAMKEKVAAAFGKWAKAEEKLPAEPVVGDGPAQKVFFARKTDVNQATVILGHLGMRRDPNDPDYAATIVANDILGGGGFAARLLQRVRTEMGLAYGVYSSYNAPYSHKGTFSLTCQTKSKSTLEAIGAIRKELEKIIAEPVTADELRVAKQSIQQQLIFESETRAEVIRRALRYEYWGFPQDFLERFQAAIAKVTAEDVARVAKARFHPERLVTLVVGNDKEFDGPLAKLGEVVELDIHTAAWPPKSAAAAAGPTPEQVEKGRAIVAKAIAAKGGREALEAVKTIRIKGKGTQLTQMGPMPIQITQTMAFPDRSRVEMLMGPMKIIYACDATKAWAQAPQGIMDVPESEAKQLRDQVRRDEIPLLLSLAAPDAKPAAVGVEDGLDVVDAGEGVKLFIDADGRLVRRSEMGAQGEQVSVWSDFRKVAGVEFPGTSKVMAGGEEQGAFTIDSIEVNVEVTPEMFAKPSGDEMQPGPRREPAGGQGGNGARPPAEREKSGAGH